LEAHVKQIKKGMMIVRLSPAGKSTLSDSLSRWSSSYWFTTPIIKMLG